MKTNHIALLEDDCLSSVTGGTDVYVKMPVKEMIPNKGFALLLNSFVKKYVLPKFRTAQLVEKL